MADKRWKDRERRWWADAAIYPSGHQIRTETDAVYFVQLIETDIYKIGKSSTVNQRLMTIEQAIPVGDIKIVAVRFFPRRSGEYGYKPNHLLEKRLHDIYKNQRVKGEWFRFDDDTVNKVKRQMQEFDPINYPFGDQWSSTYSIYPKEILGLLSVKGFIDFFYDMLPKFDNHIAAYEATERVYEQHYGVRRYSDYSTFTVAKSRYFNDGGMV